MRDFSKVSPTVWRSKKFRSLGNMDARFVYLYLLTCPHGNSAGCFDIHPMYACADMGISDQQYADCIDTLCKAGLVEWDEAENTVLITNWAEFNAPANPKHALGIIAQLLQASSEHLRLKAFQELMGEISARKFDRDVAIRKAIDTFCEPYRNGIPTETKTETETERETRPDQTKTETREKSRTPLRSVAALMGDGRTASEIEDHPLLNTSVMKGIAR